MINSVTFSADGTLVASGSADGTVHMWDVRMSPPTTRPIIKLPRSISSVSFSPNGAYIASGCNDQTISVWDVRTRNPVADPLKGHTGLVSSLTFSPDGKYIASGSSDTTIRIWETKSWKAAVGPLNGHYSYINTVGFSPNGNRIVSCAWDKTIRVWDAYTGTLIGDSLRGHTGVINGAIFSPGGDYIFSASSDKTIRVWNVQQESKIQSTDVAPIQINGDYHSPVEPLETQTDEGFVLVTHPNTGAANDARIVTANNPNHSNQTSANISPKRMSALEMLNCLTAHGCVDLSPRMDLDQYSPAAIVGGSFADIWRGKLKDGTDVAIKSIRVNPGLEDGGKRSKRAMRELYNWSKATHKNIQELIGVIIFQGRLGMVSPWMDEGNLREYIKAHPSVDRYQLCLELAEGLSYIHSVNLVHGDLKSFNILVSRDGAVRISDFDHSILLDATLEFSSTSNIGGGTLRWMCPELLLPDISVTRSKKADVYALGMTMLVGPFWKPAC
ncbi:WD40 repeat-like protein [Ceratobasidium sp. AG-I]|nr:WD40 repeat-like protein [Ceratobasidium sp. AG-I]